MFIEARELGGGGQRSGYSEVSASVVRMFLRRLQKWSNTGGQSIMLASNKPSSTVDPAMLRSGRFEVYVYPPPTRDSVLLLAELMGRRVDPGEAERAAAYAPTFSNIVEWLRSGRLPRYTPGRDIMVLAPGVEVPRARSDPGDLVVAEEYPVSLAAAVLLAASLDDRPLVAVADPMRLEEAAWIAEYMGAPVAVPYSPALSPFKLSAVRTRRILLGREWRVSYTRVTLETLEKLVPGLRRALGCVSLSPRCLVEKLLPSGEDIVDQARG